MASIWSMDPAARSASSKINIVVGARGENVEYSGGFVNVSIVLSKSIHSMSTISVLTTL